MGVFLGDYSIHGKRPSVEKELAKHGSHNQKTHGGGGSRSSSGGGISKTEARKDLVKANNAMNNGYDKIVNEERKPGQPMSTRHLDASQQRDDAFNFTEDALGGISKGDSKGAAQSLRSAADSLAGESAYKIAEKQFRALADKVESGLN